MFISYTAGHTIQMFYAARETVIVNLCCQTCRLRKQVKSNKQNLVM